MRGQIVNGGFLGAVLGHAIRPAPLGRFPRSFLHGKRTERRGLRSRQRMSQESIAFRLHLAVTSPMHRSAAAPGKVRESWARTRKREVGIASERHPKTEGSGGRRRRPNTEAVQATISTRRRTGSDCVGNIYVPKGFGNA